MNNLLRIGTGALLLALVYNYPGAIGAWLLVLVAILGVEFAIAMRGKKNKQC